MVLRKELSTTMSETVKMLFLVPLTVTLLILSRSPLTSSLPTSHHQSTDTLSHHEQSFNTLRKRHDRKIIGVDGDKDIANKHELRHLTQPDWSYYHTAYEIETLINSYAEQHNQLITVSYPYRDTNHNHIQLNPPVYTTSTHSDAESVGVCSGTSAATHHDPIIHNYCHGTHLQLIEIYNKHSDINDTEKLHVLLTFGEHGREIISSEIALNLLAILTNDHQHLKYHDNHHTNGGAHERSVNDEAFVTFLSNHVHFYIIPLLNIWGHEQVEQGQTCVRKNINGVDPNRNYDAHFLYDPDININSEQYPGIQPFTELESQYVRDIGKYIESNHRSIDLYINIHSGVKEMYYGYDYSPELIPNHHEVAAMLELVNEKHCQCTVGGAGRIGGYVVHGGSMDYFYEVMNVKNSLTFEVYGGDSAHQKDGFFDCFPFFNPTTLSEYKQAVHDWSWSFMTASAYLLVQKYSIDLPTLPQYLITNSSLLQPHQHSSDNKHQQAGWPNWHSLQPKKQQDIPPYVFMLTIIVAVFVVLALMILLYRYLRYTVFGGTTYHSVKERQSPKTDNRIMNV